MAIDGPLQGKNILVTGASSGLGRALVKEGARRGNQVFAAARSMDKLRNLAHEVGESGGQGRLTPIEADVRDPASIQNLFALIDQMVLKVDVVINNAAVGHNSSIGEITDEEATQIVSTNLLGTIMITREAIKRMIPHGSGQIAFISSLAGKLAFPNLAVYSATKFGVEGFAEAAREELGATGIGVTLIRPGIMDTNFFKTAGMGDFARNMKNKMQTPEDVARQALEAIERNKSEITIGSDKRFLPFLKHFPRSIARKLLPYIT